MQESMKEEKQHNVKSERSLGMHTFFFFFAKQAETIKQVNGMHLRWYVGRTAVFGYVYEL